MEFDYQNSSINPSEINITGDELNHSVLLDSTSKAGAREFNYSNKSSSSSSSNSGSSSSSIRRDDLSKTIESNTIAEASASSSSVATTVGTSAAVGGVVIATVVIFTSLLGNQFKLVDDSLALSLYRDNETNQVNLDYSFDLQYDKSGSVYVKLISASHNLTSEEYKIVYEGQEQEIIEYEEGEDVPSEEKTKDIYSITIEGSFYSLREKNEYTFAITSVIDGVESSIYTRNIYIPSTYVDVVEGGSYYYQDEESKVNLISYFYQVEYESNAEAYVELKHVSSNGDFSIVETSEVYLLDTSDPEMQIEDTNRYMTFIEGTFSSSVINHDEYIVSFITTSGGHTNVAYTERFIVDIEDIPPEPPIDEYTFSFIDEPEYSLNTYYGSIYLVYHAKVDQLYSGTVEVNIYDSLDTSEAIYTNTFAVQAMEDGQGLSLDDEIYGVEVGHTYNIVFTSTIGKYSAEIHSSSYLVDGEFAYVDEQNTSFTASSYVDQFSSEYTFSYTLTLLSQVNGTNLRYELLNSNNSIMQTEIIAEEFSVEFSGASGEYGSATFNNTIHPLEEGPYTFKVYVTFANEQLLYTSDLIYPESLTPFSFAHEPSTNISLVDGSPRLSYSASIVADKEGSVKVSVTDSNDESIIHTETTPITPNGQGRANTEPVSEGVSIYASDLPVEFGHDYILSFVSIIDTHEAEIYREVISPDGEYASINQDSSFQAHYYTDEYEEVHHVFSYDIYLLSEANGTDLRMEVLDSNENIVYYETIVEAFSYSNEMMQDYHGSFEVNQQGPYTAKIYATFGQEHLLYTSETIQEQEPTQYYFIADPEVEFYADAGILNMSYHAIINADYEGTARVSIIDVTAGESGVYSEDFEVTYMNGDGYTLSGFVQVDASHQYRLEVYSIINSNYQQIWSEIYNVNGVFAEISGDSLLNCYYYSSGNDIIHELSYSLYLHSQIPGTNLRLEVWNSLNETVASQLLDSDFPYTGEAEYKDYSGSLEINNNEVYKVVVFATFGQEETIFEREVEESAALSYDINDDGFSTEVYYEDTVQAQVGCEFVADVEGQMYFEFINNKTSEIVYITEPQTVAISTPETTYIGDTFDIPDHTTSYNVKVHSVINDIDIVCYTGLLSTNIEYGYSPDNLSVSEHNEEGTMIYEVSGAFDTFKSCTLFAVFSDESTGETFTTGIVEFAAGTRDNFNLRLEGGLEANKTYNVVLYANWGQTDFEMNSTEYTAIYYNIDAYIDSAVSDYQNETLTLEVMIDDEYGRISSFEAVIEFPEMDALTTGNTFIGEYDEGTHSFVFYLTGVAPDSIGNLLITGYDSQYDNNVVITFVNTTIIY